MSCAQDTFCGNNDTSITGAERVWYALRSRSQHERKIESQIREREIQVEVLLPRYRVTDGRRTVEPLLFPGYVFICAQPNAISQISWCVGFAGWISFQGRPSVIPNSEIEVLRHAVDLNPKPVSSYKPGQKVRVVRGLLTGSVGTIERIKGGCRLILKLLQCMPSLYSVEVDESDCQLVAEGNEATWQQP